MAQKNKFKLSDLPILIKNDRRFQIGAGIVLLIILWPLIDPTKDNQRLAPPRLQPPAQVVNTGRVGDEESSSDLIKAFQEEAENNRKETASIRKELREEIETRKQVEERTAEIFRKVLERFSEVQGGGGSVQGAGGVTPENFEAGGEVQNVSLDTGGHEVFGDDGDQGGIPLPPAPKRDAFIGPGDTVRVKLLSGVNAPTDGNPYPVVFQLVGDVIGPDGQSLPLGEARVVAAAQGSLSDQRALFRLTSLNLRLPTGRRKTLEVDGWVVGEDGIRGLSGVLIDPIGPAIAGGILTGTLAGVGEGLSSANSTTIRGPYGGGSSFVSGDIGQYAAGQGLARGAETWESIIKDRLDQLVPVVQVLSNREATAVFAKSAVITDLYEELDADDAGDFDSLD